MASGEQTPHNALRLIEREMRKDAQKRGHDKLSADVESAFDLLWEVVLLGAPKPAKGTEPAEEVDDRDEVTQ